MEEEMKGWGRKRRDNLVRSGGKGVEGAEKRGWVREGRK